MRVRKTTTAKPPKKWVLTGSPSAVSGQVFFAKKQGSHLGQVFLPFQGGSFRAVFLPPQSPGTPPKLFRTPLGHEIICTDAAHPTKNHPQNKTGSQLDAVEK